MYDNVVGMVATFYITDSCVKLASSPILPLLQYLLSLSVLATLEDALGDRWSRCFPRFILALFVCSLTFAISLYFATQVS